MIHIILEGYKVNIDVRKTFQPCSKRKRRKDFKMTNAPIFIKAFQTASHLIGIKLFKKCEHFK